MPVPDNTSRIGATSGSGISRFESDQACKGVFALEGGFRLKGEYGSSSSDCPLITVITVTYNAVETLERTINSVKDQNYTNVEHLIIDGGSTDGTFNLLQKHGDQIDYWLSEPDAGIYDAMNKGVNLATGDWLYFLGADDILVNCLHKIAPELCRKNTIYYGDVYLPTKNKTYGGEFTFHTLASKNINHQSIFYPRKVFDKYQYSLKYPVWADYALNLQCWGDPEFNFRYLPILVCIHDDTGFSQGTVDSAFEADRSALMNRAFGRKLALRRSYLNLRTHILNLLEVIRLKRAAGLIFRRFL